MAARTEARDIEVAFHEAGHAVVMMVLGVRIDHVSIDPDSDTDGTVVPVGTSRNGSPDPQKPTTLGRWGAERDVMVALAGPLAAMQYVTDEDALRSSVAGDLDHAIRAIRSVCGSTEEAAAMLQWLRIRTQNLLNAQWHAVAILAATLREKRTLTEQEAADAVAPYLVTHNDGARVGLGLGARFKSSLFEYQNEVMDGLFADLRQNLPPRTHNHELADERATPRRAS